MKQKTRDALAEALFEAFFVVLGVVLALAANEWRQALADRERGRAALASVVEELESNRAAVAESLDYHSGLLERLSDLRRDSGTPDARDFSRGFVSPAQLFDTAWESAAATGALAHMEYATVLELSRLYARQERYEAQAESIAEIIYGELFRQGFSGMLESYDKLANLIGTFSYREAQLLERYDATLASIAPHSGGE